MSLIQRSVFICAVSAGISSAQISGLATTADGSKVYFVTSLRQSGSTQSAASKVFVLANQMLTLVAQTSATDLNGFPVLFNRPSVNGAGTIIATNAALPCEIGRSCSSTIRTPTGSFTLEGNISLSASGLFAAVYGNYYQAPPLSVRLVDLVRGTVAVAGPQPATEGQFVTDDGTLMVGREGGVRVSGPKGIVDLATASPMWRALLAPDASRIVYATLHSELHVLDVASGLDRSFGPGFSPMLAADGRSIAYLYAPPSDPGFIQIWLADAITGASRALTAEPEAIRDLAFTRDGSRVFAATVSGRLLAINTATGAVTELLGAVGPTAVGLAYQVVPGSYNELVGYFPDSFDPDVRASGTRALVLERKLDRIAIQIPWDTKPDPQVGVVLRTQEPAWEQVLRVGVLAIGGSALPVGPPRPGRLPPYAINEGWSSVVDSARPGEVIHMYGTGWGPVDGNLTDGQPTPADRLYRITTPCDWRAGFPSPARPLEMLFAGLAPGLTGVYQFDFRIPEDWPDQSFSAFCRRVGTTDIILPDISVRR